MGNLERAMKRPAMCASPKRIVGSASSKLERTPTPHRLPALALICERDGRKNRAQIGSAVRLGRPSDHLRLRELVGAPMRPIESGGAPWSDSPSDGGHRRAVEVATSW